MILCLMLANAKTEFGKARQKSLWREYVFRMMITNSIVLRVGVIYN